MGLNRGMKDQNQGREEGPDLGIEGEDQGQGMGGMEEGLGQEKGGDLGPEKEVQEEMGEE